MEGKGGSEDIRVHAVKDMHVTVDNDREVHVKKHLKETVDNGQEVTIAQGYKETITEGATSTISGGLKSTVNGPWDSKVNGKFTETVTGGEERTVSSGKKLTVTGARDTRSSDHIPPIFTRHGAGTYTSEASLKFAVAGSVIEITPSSITISIGASLDHARCLRRGCQRTEDLAERLAEPGTMPLNAVERRLLDLRYQWEDFADDPVPRLLVWTVPDAAMRLVRCFLEVQKHEGEYVTRDLFIVFDAPFENSIQYSRALKEALAGQYAASSDDLAREGLESSVARGRRGIPRQCLRVHPDAALVRRHLP